MEKNDTKLYLVHNQSFQNTGAKPLLPQKELGVTDYSKRVRSKYLLNYYNKIGKDRREASRSKLFFFISFTLTNLSLEIIII